MRVSGHKGSWRQDFRRSCESASMTTSTRRSVTTVDVGGQALYDGFQRIDLCEQGDNEAIAIVHHGDTG